MIKQSGVTNWKHCLTVTLWVSILAFAIVQPSQSRPHTHAKVLKGVHTAKKVQRTSDRLNQASEKTGTEAPEVLKGVHTVKKKIRQTKRREAATGKTPEI